VVPFVVITEYGVILGAGFRYDYEKETTNKGILPRGNNKSHYYL